MLLAFEDNAQSAQVGLCLDQHRTAARIEHPGPAMRRSRENVRGRVRPSPVAPRRTALAKREEARRRAESKTASEPTSAPVCDTAALEPCSWRPDFMITTGFVRAAAAAFPGKVAVGLDARNGKVATRGWAETTELEAVDLAKAFEDAEQREAAAEEKLARATSNQAAIEALLT